MAKVRRREFMMWGLAVGAVLAGLGAAVFLQRFERGTSGVESGAEIRTTDSGERISAELARRVAELEAREEEMGRTVWANELLAQECGRSIELFWDEINRATNKLRAAAGFEVGEVVLAEWKKQEEEVGHGIELLEPSTERVHLRDGDWNRFVDAAEEAGWILDAVEFRHNAFETDAAGMPARSFFYFCAQLRRLEPLTRMVVEGELGVEWAGREAGQEMMPVARIDASKLAVKRREGETPFQELLVESVEPPVNSYSIDPLIVYDLDGDGFSEIILANKNLLYRRQPSGSYEAEPLCRVPPGLLYTGLVADFDGDGAADFLCGKYEGLFLFKGSEEGTFEEPGRPVGAADWSLGYPMVMTCGDVDRDGDLDVFLGQYRVPYERGAMPTPYYDAKDGHPSYLWLNDGQGRFEDGTEAAGLGENRRRHTYSASFVHLNDDEWLDLVVVSDFAGVDLYINEGDGRFRDRGGEWVKEGRAFGMGHAFADVNRDGRLDFLMTGMTSATASRLEHMGLWRDSSEEGTGMRAAMTFGNRLYLGRSEEGFAQTELGESIARSGWSWGCGALDFDNDGFADFYIVNGMESRESVRDYESEYWLHDRFVGNSRQDAVAYYYFKKKFSRTRGRGQSYGGYDRNRLYWNREAATFLEVGYLLGVGTQEDSRNVVAEDVDGDGRVDLVTTSFELWPENRQRLRIYQNRLLNSGNWVGVRLREEGKGRSPAGARVVVRYDGYEVAEQIVTGDSYRAQHPAVAHFGLGAVSGVDSLTVKWTDGEVVRIENPEMNRHHWVSGGAED